LSSAWVGKGGRGEAASRQQVVCLQAAGRELQPVSTRPWPLPSQLQDTDLARRSRQISLIAGGKFVYQSSPGNRRTHPL
jgi:hypothetical protein